MSVGGAGHVGWRSVLGLRVNWGRVVYGYISCTGNLQALAAAVAAAVAVLVAEVAAAAAVKAAVAVVVATAAALVAAVFAELVAALPDYLKRGEGVDDDKHARKVMQSEEEGGIRQWRLCLHPQSQSKNLSDPVLNLTRP
jgi:hypothetical protein